MRHNVSNRFVSSLILLILVFSACGTPEQEPLRIAAAANLQYAIHDLVSAFRQNEPIPVDIITSSSGKLTAQIEQGAPFDIFISADMKYPTVLYENGYSSQAPEIYAYGQLVLWTMDTTRVLALENLTDLDYDRVAIANPRTAPYGIATQELLQNLDLYDTLKPRFVYGESISQTSQFIQSGAVDAGFTAKSILFGGPARGTGRFSQLPTDQYTQIAQGAILLDGRINMHPKSDRFYRFLFSDEAGEILSKHGYNLSSDHE